MFSTFIHKDHPGNKFASLHISKNLSEVEKLRLIVAKLEIENERLKRMPSERLHLHTASGSLSNEKKVTVYQ